MNQWQLQRIPLKHMPERGEIRKVIEIPSVLMMLSLFKGMMATPQAKALTTPCTYLCCGEKQWQAFLHYFPLLSSKSAQANALALLPVSDHT